MELDKFKEDDQVALRCALLITPFMLNSYRLWQLQKNKQGPIPSSKTIQGKEKRDQQQCCLLLSSTRVKAMGMARRCDREHRRCPPDEARVSSSYPNMPAFFSVHFSPGASTLFSGTWGTPQMLTSQTSRLFQCTRVPFHYPS